MAARIGRFEARDRRSGWSIAGAVGLVVAGCASCAGSGTATAPLRPGACAPSRLATCEGALVAEVTAGRPAAPVAVRAWIDGRRAVDAHDAWVRAWDQLTAPTQTARTGVIHGPGVAAPAGARDVAIERPGALDGASVDALLVALADGAGVDALARVDGDATTIAFGRDPLAPLVPDVAPVVHGLRADLEADLGAASIVARAIDAAAGGASGASGAAVGELRAALGRGAGGEDTRARAALAIQALEAAGLAARGAPIAKGRAAPPTPYAAFVRLTTGRAGVELVPLVVSAVPQPRRDAVERLLTPRSSCAVDAAPPPLDAPHALAVLPVFARRADGAGRGGVTRAAAWADRFAEAVETTRRARAGWAYGALLVRFGGELGVGPRAPASVAAAELATRAARAIQSGAARASSAPLSALAATSPYADAGLKSAVHDVVQAAARAPVAAANDADAILAAAAGVVFASAAYPPELRDVAIDAVDGAVSGRLHGELTQATGWSVAALYAADAAAHAATGRKADVDFAATQVARALGAPGTPRPELASLGAVAARYAALASAGRLDPAPRDAARLPAARRDARAALRGALAALGPAGEAPNNVLDDVTDLADGLAGVLAAPRVPVPDPKTARAPVCAAKDGREPAPGGLTEKARRSLAKLGDVRQRILSHPRFRSGDGAWLRRARLFVLVASDAMDLALRDTATGEARRTSGLAIAAADAEGFIRAALGEGDLAPLAAPIARAYVIARSIAVDRDRRSAPHPTGGDVASVADELAVGLAARATGADAGVLGALARAAGRGASSGDGLLVRWNAALAAADRRDEADLVLLAALVVEAASDAPPSRELVDAALARHSRVGWALALVAEMDLAREGKAPDVERFAAPLRAAARGGCGAARGAEAVIEVGRSLAEAANARRTDAAKRLDAVLDAAERDGLALPKVAFRYERRDAGRAVGLTIDVSAGFGPLRGSTEFQLDAGVTTADRAGASLTNALGDEGVASSADEAARYYVSISALAAAQHLLGGDVAAGTRDAARAIGAATHGVRLGPRALRPAPGFGWARDARGTLAVVAELAAEHNVPLLAGDAFTIVARSLPANADVAAIDDVLARAPLGLAGADAAPALEHARASLHLLAHALPCGRRGDAPGLAELGCDGYARAIALREADAVKHLPRLSRKARGGPTCEAFRALDVFLVSADRKTYEPDALATAASAFAAAERPYEAAVLLARYKRRGHCSGPIVGLDRTLGRSAAPNPGLRADVLSDAVNCAGPSSEDDLLALDAATRTLADPTRNLHVLLSVADRAAQSDAWGPLLRLAAEPSFVDRWIGVNPTAATAALLVRHAVAKLDPSAARADLDTADRFLCMGAPDERAPLCSAIERLRAPGADAAVAKQAVRDMAATSATPRP